MSKFSSDSKCLGRLINLALVGGLLFVANDYPTGVRDSSWELKPSMEQKNTLVDLTALDSNKKLVHQ